MKIACMVGEIRVAGELRNWNLEYVKESPEPGLELVRLRFHAPEPSEPPNIRLEWGVPQHDMQFRWHTGAMFQRNIPPNWAGPLESSLAHHVPLVQLGSLGGENRLTFALSEARRLVKVKAGVCEESNEIDCSIELFSVPEAPLAIYETVLRLDARPLFYAEALRQAFHWFETFPECRPAAVPAAAFDPVYSSWYSFHQQLFDRELEEECRLAAAYGMKGIIVDDGWQTDDCNRGYAFCGDWEISKNRFPDMRAHVAKIHELGMKYLVWFAVPFVGKKSRNVERFRGKYLVRQDGLDTYVLDPRFPEVREFLISIYENALREWDIDGFKLDFIDMFRFDGEDPAAKENYAGRDIKSLPEAVDRLLSEVMMRLNRIKPGILIEFRQAYIGPAIRKYGSMFRAGDCPADVLSNRVRTIDLRLSSGATAVHSDMLEWSASDTAETAALQFLNILFSVPQISVKLGTVPERHREMLRFWLGFWMSHRETLMRGTLRPLHPALNYPVVIADGDDEQIVAVYNPGMTVPVDCAAGRRCLVVNGSGAEELVLDFASRPVGGESFDVVGNAVERLAPESGLVRVRVPRSGLLVLQF